MNKNLILISLLLVVTLTACRPSSSEEAEDAFCQSLISFGEAYVSLLAVDARNDRSGLEAAWNDTLDAYADLSTAAEEMRSVKLNDLELAFANLRVTIKAALGVSPTDEALQGIQKAAGDVQDAYDDLVNVNCGGY